MERSRRRRRRRVGGRGGRGGDGASVGEEAWLLAMGGRWRANERNKKLMTTLKQMLCNIKAINAFIYTHIRARSMCPK